MSESNYISMNAPVPDEYTESGYLIVTVYTARGAIPIENALVTVNYFSQKFDAVSPYAVLTTDKSGRTPPLALPAPPRDLSLSPSESGETPPLPYARYNIEVFKEGFYPVVNIGAQLFSGITAIQNTNLVPISESLPQTFYKDDTVYIDESEGNDL